MATFTLTDGADTYVQNLIPDRVGATINGLDGNDRITLNRVDDLGGGNVVNAGSGRDVVDNFKEQGNLIRLQGGDDVYLGRGFGSFGTDTPDLVTGGAGNDTFAFETFQSGYRGDSGNDTFLSVGWQNRIAGGRGSDTVDYSGRDRDSTQGGTGVAIDLAAGEVATGASRIERLSSIENAIGTNERDEISGTGGANRLTGGGGADFLQGRGGADVFVYTRASHGGIFEGNTVDLIADFSRAGGDRIDLDAVDANANRRGNQDFTFSADDSFSGRAGEVIFAEGFVQADRNGDREVDFAIDMNGLAGMRAGDFLL
jgi:Ca2+-binding RTX toxin-like protein